MTKEQYYYRQSVELEDTTIYKNTYIVSNKSDYDWRIERSLHNGLSLGSYFYHGLYQKVHRLINEDHSLHKNFGNYGVSVGRCEITNTPTIDIVTYGCYAHFRNSKEDEPEDLKEMVQILCSDEYDKYDVEIHMVNNQGALTNFTLEEMDKVMRDYFKYVENGWESYKKRI